MEYQLNENHDSNLKVLLTDIKSKKIKHVILNMKFVTHFNVLTLPMLLFGSNLFVEAGSFVLCEIPLDLEKIIKANPSVEKINFLPTLEEAIEFVMLMDQENMPRNEV